MGGGGAFVYTPAGAAAPAPDGSFPTQSVTPPVPDQYSRYQSQIVPGLGNHLGDVPHTNISMATNTTMLDALGNLLQMGTDNQQLVTIQEGLIKAGFLNPSDTTFQAGSVAPNDATYDAYAKMLATSIAKNTDYGDLLQSLIGNPKNTRGQEYWQKFQQATGQAPVVKTENSTTTNITDAPDARAVAQSEYESLLGRNVNDQEAAAFQGGLDAYERANPTNTSSRVSYDPTVGDQPELRSSTSTGGINEGGMAQLADSNIIQNHGKEYAKVQGDQIYQLLASLLGGSGG